MSNSVRLLLPHISYILDDILDVHAHSEHKVVVIVRHSLDLVNLFINLNTVSAMANGSGHDDFFYTPCFSIAFILCEVLFFLWAHALSRKNKSAAISDTFSLMR